MVNTIILSGAQGIIVQILLLVTLAQSEIEGQYSNLSYYHSRFVINLLLTDKYTILQYICTIYKVLSANKRKGVSNVVFKKFHQFHLVSPFSASQCKLFRFALLQENWLNFLELSGSVAHLKLHTKGKFHSINLLVVCGRVECFFLYFDFNKYGIL